MPGTEAASQFEVLALGGFERLPKSLDLVAVPLLEHGELGGEGARDAARRVVGRWHRRPRWAALLLCPQLLDATPDVGVPLKCSPG